jgi:hypothetical protein
LPVLLGLAFTVALLAGPAPARAQTPAPDPLAGLVPAPQVAEGDRGRLYADGCMMWGEETVSGRCVYGNPRSRRRVVIFGDSRAMQYFDPLEPVARNRSWRLVGLIKGNCVVAQVRFERYCDAWRENSLRRIERARPDLVIVGSATKGMYRVKRGSKQLGSVRSQPYLVRGFAATLRRLKATGAKVLVIRDQSLAPFSPPVCLVDMQNTGFSFPGVGFDACSYRAASRAPRAFDLRGARRARVRTIDPQPLFCPGGLCSPVIGNTVVFRDTYHLSATYARTLTGWLARRLPPVPR